MIGTLAVHGYRMNMAVVPNENTRPRPTCTIPQTLVRASWLEPPMLHFTSKRTQTRNWTRSHGAGQQGEGLGVRRGVGGARVDISCTTNAGVCGYVSN